MLETVNFTSYRLKENTACDMSKIAQLDASPHPSCSFNHHFPGIFFSVGDWKLSLPVKSSVTRKQMKSCSQIRSFDANDLKVKLLSL